jgi:transposase
MRAVDSTSVKTKYQKIAPFLDERARRVWAASEATEIGYGGVSAVSVATGISRTTIRAGMREPAPTQNPGERERLRQRGAGRKKLTSKDTSLLECLERLVDSSTRGDPMKPLCWTCKSTKKLARELSAQGHSISARSVSTLLGELGYSLQSNRKVMEGKSHPDRDAQFRFINEKVSIFHQLGEPAISVDTKKKELIGDYKNAGREYQPKGEPQKVKAHDFPDPKLGKAIPYGVYDVGANQGWVSVGVDHDTAEFATETIRRWWEMMGKTRYPAGKKLLIMADGGGSNSSRSRLWKKSLQKLADEIGLELIVCHFPPATSKWNKIEHRMFCHITQNWRGRPLVSHQAVVELIGATTTQKGLKIQAELNTKTYPLKQKVTKKQMEEIRLSRDAFHGEWNYTIHHATAPS